MRKRCEETRLMSFMCKRQDLRSFCLSEGLIILLTPPYHNNTPLQAHTEDPVIQMLLLSPMCRLLLYLPCVERPLSPMCGKASRPAHPLFTRHMRIRFAKDVRKLAGLIFVKTSYEHGLNMSKRPMNRGLGAYIVS